MNKPLQQLKAEKAEQAQATQALKSAYRGWSKSDVGQDLITYLSSNREQLLYAAQQHATNGENDKALGALQTAAAYSTLKVYIDRMIG